MTEKEATTVKFDINQLQELVKAVAGFAYEKKANDIVGIDLTGICPVTDYFLICSGGNKPQIKAICDNIEEKLEEQGLRPLRTEGYQDADWVLLDYGHLVVHVFSEEDREYFNLERLWGDAPIVRFSPTED